MAAANQFGWINQGGGNVAQQNPQQQYLNNQAWGAQQFGNALDPFGLNPLSTIVRQRLPERRAGTPRPESFMSVLAVPVMSSDRMLTVISGGHQPRQQRGRLVLTQRQPAGHRVSRHRLRQRLEHHHRRGAGHRHTATVWHRIVDMGQRQHRRRRRRGRGRHQHTG